MGSRRSYGDAVAHSFSIPSAPRLVTRSLPGAQIGISRLSIGPRQLGLTPRIPPEDTFIAAVYLTDVAHHELFRGGRPFLSQGYAAHSMRIVNLVDNFSANVTDPHESLVFYLPRTTLDAVMTENGGRRTHSLVCPPGIIDPAVEGLTKALLPAFERPHEVGMLFIDHVTQALCAHLTHRYGGLQRSPVLAKGGLSPRQSARAQAFLIEHAATDVTLREVAQQCDLSPAYFIKAFKRTMGVTPHQWLLRHRVEQAKAMMLETTTPIGEIAPACGFADQSHLTRIFKLLVGESPAAWRRQRQG